MNIYENNNVSLTGSLVRDFAFSHEAYGEQFYEGRLSVERLSGKTDIIPLIVSSKLLNTEESYIGVKINIFGQFRSRNVPINGRNHLDLYVFASDVYISDGSDENTVFLQGTICKAPNYRETPLRREICDMHIAVNNTHRRSYYIPVITWGRNANFTKRLEVGTHVKVWGRIQSREYKKDGNTQIAYEVSAMDLEVDNDET